MIPGEHYHNVLDALEWLHQECVKELERQGTKSPLGCDPHCPGWAVFNTGSEKRSVQRCDDCAVFIDDDAAMTYALTRLKNRMAARLDEEKRDEDEPKQRRVQRVEEGTGQHRS